MDSRSYKVNDFTVKVDKMKSLGKDLYITPNVKDEAIGFVFYNKGQIEVNTHAGNKFQTFNKKSGIASSFYVNPDAKISHAISSKSDLEKVTVFMTIEKVKAYISDEEVHFYNHLSKLLIPNSDFVEGNQFNTSPNMDSAMHKIFNSEYAGITQRLFMESQIAELIFSYFNAIDISNQNISKLKKIDIDKIHHAKDLLIRDLESPPDIKELARLSELNTFKLKTGFKEIFGLPVYTYLQSKRLEHARDLIQNKCHTVQEAAWETGYSSLGSFSNAFLKKFGYRPSRLFK